MRRLKVGDTVRQTLSGYEDVTLRTVLYITRETDNFYTAFFFSPMNPPGIYFASIDKAHVENEYFSQSRSTGRVRMRTEIL